MWILLTYLLFVSTMYMSSAWLILGDLLFEVIVLCLSAGTCHLEKC